MMLLAALGASALLAAPAGSPVAEGFPAWQGVSPKNYIMGREITDADLRHKVTVVIEVKEDDGLQAQILKAAELVSLSPLAQSHMGDNWETRVLPRDDIYLISVHGKSKELLEPFKAALKLPKDSDENTSRLMASVRSPSVPVYAGVTLAEPVNAEGKYPFVYVMGPKGKEPVFKGVLDDAGVKGARAAISKERKALAAAENKWVEFFGNVTEDKYPPALVKAIEKGKTTKTVPLAPVVKAIQKDIVSKDAEKAQTAQILCDALEQTRSDLVMRIKMEAGECPHRAAYDAQQLLKFWPGEKKRLDAVLAKLKAVPEANKLAQMFCKVMVWADGEFTCKNAGEAKKIVAELGKMKKDLEKLKESKIIVVQNGALLLDVQVDELISVIPSKVPEKAAP